MIFGGAVLALFQLEQFRSLLDKCGVTFSAYEGRMVQHIDQERNIGFDASDTHFTHSADRFTHSALKSTVVGNSLYKEAVIKGEMTAPV